MDALPRDWQRVCYLATMMHRLFWFLVGAAVGVFGYRYYRDSGGRLPLVEELSGRSPDDIAAEAKKRAGAAKHKAEQATSEAAAKIATETVREVAEEITEAERAKEQQQTGGPPPA